jgi:transposase
VSGSFAANNVAPSNLAELKRWLEQMVRHLAFTRLIAAIVALVARLTDINAELAKQLAQLRRARPRSERWRAIEAQLVFTWTLAAAAAGEKSDSPPPTSQSHPEESKSPPKKESRKGQHPGRQVLPPNLKRVPQYNAVPAELRRCPKCGLEMGPLGHTHCEYLEVKPAEVFVVRRSDEALRCKLDGTIVSAPPPPRIVERGVLGDRLIIEATADKFLEHQPIERQCLRYARSGVEIAPQTLGRCVGAHIDLLAPLADAIVNKTRGAGLLATDATGLPILDPEAPQGIRSGTLWAWTNALWVSFVYSPDAGSESVKRFLGEGNYGRTVQADGTNLLTFIERAGGRRPGCWSHARRGLVLCARSGDRVALEGVRLIAPLFAVERESKLAGDNAAQRKERRWEKSKPHTEAIFAWVDEQRSLVPPKTALGRALGYLHRQRVRLLHFLEDGNVALTNNRRERELRKPVLGRRNWLFAWKDIGGERLASILTILNTAIAHGLNPREYLVVVTEAMLKGQDVVELLPDRIAHSRPELRVPWFEEPPLPD